MTTSGTRQAISKQRLEELDGDYRGALLKDTVPFWLDRCADFVDPEYGGYMICRDADGQLVDTDKGIWQQGRTAWFFASLFNDVEPREQWLAAAASGVDFLQKHGFDASDGRMWFHVTRKGQPIRKRRYAFSEAFTALAFGSYAKATHDGALAERAASSFRSFLLHKPEPKFTAVRPTRGIGVPMIAINVAQNLRASIQLEEANAVIDECIDTIERYFVKDDIRCVMETVGEDGCVLDHFEGRTLNPGHAIEAAWFILHEARIRGDDTHLIDLGCRILDYMWERGWDEEHGGILYFTDVHGKPVQEYWHDMKFWWPHCETIIATLLAYQLTGDESYAVRHRLVHDWAYKHFHDAEYGEWYGYLHRDGTPSSSLKGNLWKGPFHMPRMQLTCMKIVDELRASTSS